MMGTMSLFGYLRDFESLCFECLPFVFDMKLGQINTGGNRSVVKGALSVYAVYARAYHFMLLLHYY